MATKTNTKINGRDYYRISRTLNGKRKYFYGKSKGDAEKKYREYVESHGHKRNDRVTFRDRAEEYIENTLRTTQKYATGTKERYESLYRTHVKDSDLASMRLGDITAADIQKFYNSLDVSSSTIKGVHKFMVAFYKWAQLNGYADNVLSAVEIPKKKDTKKNEGIEVWGEDDVKTILKAADKDPFRLAFFLYVCLYTGARVSEALALRYSDFDGDTVQIKRQRYLGELKPPKYNSAREVPIHPELKKALRRHRKWHKEDMKKHGYKTNYVFTTASGRFYDQDNVRIAIKRFLQRNNIEPKKLHAFRSTFCTQLCRCGVPIEVASSLLGHKSLEVTAAHYALVKRDKKEDAIRLLKY